MTDRHRTLLGLFAKHWTPGAVKTRLAAAIGDRTAAAVHRAFVETLLARFAAEADSRVLCYSPEAAANDFQEVAPANWQLAPQEGGDLGRRMQAFFESSLRETERVVLIGSDSPDLPSDYLSAAFNALESHDVVLGPAADGGYYLVGAARRVPPIFAGIAWSTPEVWQQTTERAQSAGIAWHELPTWYDVDDEQGLRALLLSIHIEGASDPPLRALESRLLELLGDKAP
jgi:rSAM/selenodomain-associated transferase 1